MEKQNMQEKIQLFGMNSHTIRFETLEITKQILIDLLARDSKGTFHNFTHIISHFQAYQLIIEGEKLRWLPEMDSEYMILHLKGSINE